MSYLVRSAVLAVSLLLTTHSFAAQAGFRTIKVAGPEGNEPITVALYYPTTSAIEQQVALGPFSASIAMGATPDSQVKGLIILSHGNAGTEVGQTSLAEALARNGYLVAALRHPGDNWQDRSLLSKGPAPYFFKRPQHASRVIDFLLQSPEWQSRIASDDKGPLIGAVGHSAGGYTVLALAGAVPELNRVRAHCQANLKQDPIFCSMTRTDRSGEPREEAPREGPILKDARVRAVVALAPLGVVLSETSLSEISVPTLVYEAELDRYLVPTFHAQWVAQKVSGAQLRRVPNAWHYAFVDTPGIPIETVDGDVAANPPGFERPAFLKRLGEEVPAFFDNSLQHRSH